MTLFHVANGQYAFVNSQIRTFGERTAPVIQQPLVCISFPVVEDHEDPYL